ncbi:helix-turn-helix domain-containing protein [Spirillospora sp. CA-108201]
MARPLIETMDLVVFDAVARTGSFGRSAVELQLAQPSVSTRIAALERKLGVQLVTRGPRGTEVLKAASAPFATDLDRTRMAPPWMIVRPRERFGNLRSVRIGSPTGSRDYEAITGTREITPIATL